MNRARDIREAIDRCGADLATWPDRGLASEVRQALLADRGLRAWYDDAVALDRGLAAACAELDAEIAAAGTVARIEGRLGLMLPARASRRGRWIAAAAALVIAAGLGSAYDLVLGGTGDSRPFNVVVLDPLVFGPAEVESQ